MGRGVFMKKLVEVMTKNIITIGPENNLHEILEIMKTKGVGKLPVIDNGRVVGVVTRDDLLVKKEKAPIPPIIALNDLIITLPGTRVFKEKLEKITAFKASELMRKNILKVEKDTALDQVVTDILEKDYEFALVLDKEELIGLISKTNLIESF